MSTTYQTLLTAALNRSLANDAGGTALANNPAELVAVLSRTVRQVYTLSGLPPDAGGVALGQYFVRTLTVTLGTPSTTFVALPTAPELLYIFAITDAGGTKVSRASLRDLRDGLAETPPAVIVQDQTIRSCGRLGDPTAGAVLTLDGSYLPAEATLATDYVGATTPATASTSHWPSHVGDAYLIATLARYLVIKDTTRDPTELQALDAEIGEASKLLGQVLGVAPAKLSAVRPS